MIRQLVIYRFGVTLDCTTTDLPGLDLDLDLDIGPRLCGAEYRS